MEKIYRSRIKECCIIRCRALLFIYAAKKLKNTKKSQQVLQGDIVCKSNTTQ
jgi:hypothetical protein